MEREPEREERAAVVIPKRFEKESWERRREKPDARSTVPNLLKFENTVFVTFNTPKFKEEYA